MPRPIAVVERTLRVQQHAHMVIGVVAPPHADPCGASVGSAAEVSCVWPSSVPRLRTDRFPLPCSLLLGDPGIDRRSFTGEYQRIVVVAVRAVGLDGIIQEIPGTGSQAAQQTEQVQGDRATELQSYRAQGTCDTGAAEIHLRKSCLTQLALHNNRYR